MIETNNISGSVSKDIFSMPYVGQMRLNVEQAHFFEEVFLTCPSYKIQRDKDNLSFRFDGN